MTTEMRYPWRQNSQVFEERAAEYDSWFEDSLLFDIELAAMQKVITAQQRPWIEIGVGPGRFAQRLGTDIGIDPAPAALRIAAKRGIVPVAGIGEQLPLANGVAGTVSLLFTLCFLASPQAVFKECHRILRPGGHFLVGFIPARSAWGNMIARKKADQHPYYRHAHCKTVAETTQLLTQTGFALLQGCSTLYQPPDNITRFEEPRTGADENAGFCILTATRRNSNT